MGQILDSPIASLQQMSSGQLQLFAAARAILQLQALHSTNSSSECKSSRGQFMPILLLDEPTSSLDLETESTLRSIIRQEFTEKGHTVIAVTHRLNGLTKSIQSGQNVVAFLSKGMIEEFGRAEEVLGITDSSR